MKINGQFVFIAALSIKNVVVVTEWIVSTWAVEKFRKWVIGMVNKVKQRKRLRKAIKNRKKERLEKAWRNLFVRSGVLNG